MKISILKEIQLGDKIVACIIAYNLSILLKEEIEVCGDNIVKILIDGFNLENIYYSKNFQESNKLAIKDFLPFFKKSKVIFFNRPIIYCDSKHELKNIKIKDNISEKKELTYFQFDNRTSNIKKKEYSYKDKLYFLERYAKFKTIGIGGLDTIKELPYDYKLMELKDIIKEICKAKQFIGVDSGMSHLAGFFQIPSFIFVTHSELQDFKDIAYFFDLFYNNKNLFFRNSLKLFN